MAAIPQYLPLGRDFGRGARGLVEAQGLGQGDTSLPSRLSLKPFSARCCDGLLE